MAYQINTAERPKGSTEWTWNTFFLTGKQFDEFIQQVSILKDSKKNRTGYRIVFNSGLRHTACQVLDIKVPGAELYVFPHRIDDSFKKKLEKIMSSSARKGKLAGKNTAA